MIYSEDRAREELERLLPPDQVTAGRARAEQAARENLELMSIESARERLGIGEGSYKFLARGDDWSWYVRRFCAMFGLSDDQQATATAILRDVKSRRDEYISQHRREWDLLEASAIEQGTSHGAAAATQPAVDRYAFFAPVEALWPELRERLDQIPTREQIEDLRQTRPKHPATRPTDYVSGVRPTTRPARPS